MQTTRDVFLQVEQNRRDGDNPAFAAALLEIIDRFDDSDSCVFPRPEKQSKFLGRRVSCAGFPVRSFGVGFELERLVVPAPDEMIAESLRRLFPGSPALGEDIHPDGRPGWIDIATALHHPFFQAAFGLKPARMLVRARLDLRVRALALAGLPGLRRDTRRAVRETIEGQGSALLSAMEDLYARSVSRESTPGLLRRGGLLALANIAFFEEGDRVEDLEEPNFAVAARHRAIMAYPGLLPIFAPRRPRSPALCALRDAVQDTVLIPDLPASMRRALGRDMFRAMAEAPAEFVQIEEFGALPGERTGT